MWDHERWAVMSWGHDLLMAKYPKEWDQAEKDRTSSVASAVSDSAEVTEVTE